MWKQKAPPPIPPEYQGLVRDPVCKMDLAPDFAPQAREHEGETYWFCSAACANKFDADPSLYLASDDRPFEHG